MPSRQPEAMADGLHTETLTGRLPESLTIGDRVSYHSASAGRLLNAEVMAVLTDGRYRIQSDQFVIGTKTVQSAKVLHRRELHLARTNTFNDNLRASGLRDGSGSGSNGHGGTSESSARCMTGARKRPAEDEAAGHIDRLSKASRRGPINTEDAVSTARDPASDTDDCVDLGSAAQFETLSVGLLVSILSQSKRGWVPGRVERLGTATGDKASDYVVVVYVDDPACCKKLLRHQVPQHVRIPAAETSVLMEVTREAQPATVKHGEQRPAQPALPSQPQPHEVDNPYWLGLGPEGVRRAVVPPADFQLDRLTVINDFGPTNAEDVKQVLAAYLPGKMADTVQVLCMHGGCNPYTGETYPRDCTGKTPPACWNSPGGNFHCFQVSNWLYRRDGHRVIFDASTSEKHNNTWGHVHPKLLLAVFKHASVSSSQELLRVSVLTNGPFGGGVCNGRCEYAAWYSQLFPVAKFGDVTCSDFGNHLHDFIVRLVEAADKEHADNPLYFPPGQVHCQCEIGKSGACKAEKNDGRPSCSDSVMELLRVVTHADCSAADAAGFRVVSSVIGHTDPSDRCQYGHVRVNTLASQFWGSDDRKMEKTPKRGACDVAAAKAPTYAALLTEDEKRSDLSLVIIVHNIAAGCTPRFISNFGACWKIAKQHNVRVAWPAAACLVGDPDNPKIEHLFGPWLKGFDYTYRSDTYSTSSRETIKGKRHAVWQGDDHDGHNYLFKYEPHLLLPTPRRFGRWSGWKDDDPTAGPGLPLEDAQQGALASARSDAQLRNAAPLLRDAVDEKRKVLEFEKALWQAEVESSRLQVDRPKAAEMEWSCSGGEVTGSNRNAPFIDAFSTSDLSRWADEATAGETLRITGLGRAGRKRVRETIRHSDSLSTVLTTESIGYGDDRWLRITKQPYEAHRYAHHFQQYVVLDGNQNPIAFLLTSANLSSFAWGEQCQCGEELPSFGLVPDRDHRGTDDCYNANTGSHDFWMRNFEFGIMDLRPGRRGGRAECTPQSECAAQLENHWRAHALPVAVDLRNMQRFEPWEEPWCTRAHERLCQRVDEKHMAMLQQQLLDFAKPSNLGKIFPMDTCLTREERSQVRDICREICDPDFKRDIPPWLQKDRVPCVSHWPIHQNLQQSFAVVVRLEVALFRPTFSDMQCVHPIDRMWTKRVGKHACVLAGLGATRQRCGWTTTCARPQEQYMVLS